MDSFGNLKNLVDELYVLGSWIVVMAPYCVASHFGLNFCPSDRSFLLLASLEQLLT